jgi:hypothetical protein
MRAHRFNSMDLKTTTVVVDLWLRGVDEACAPEQIIYRSKFKSLDTQQRR